MNIINITPNDINLIQNEIKNLRFYLKGLNGNSNVSLYEQHLSLLINNKKFNNKTDLSKYLKTIPQPIALIPKELYNFFYNFNKQSNHYVQSALLTNIINSSSSLIYLNYSNFYKRFHILAQKSNSNESKILKNIKNNYQKGIKDYFNYFISSINSNLSPISLINQPQTYFINNYTETMLNTGIIENTFMNGIYKKSLNVVDIIKYFSLHYSRNSNIFVSQIKSLYIILKKTNPISFNDYCLIQFIYHLTMIKSYCDELEYFINNINNLNFSVKNTQSIIFSDTLANTIKSRGYTGIYISGSEILIIENTNTKNVFNNEKYLLDNFFLAQEFVCVSTSHFNLFYIEIFEKYFKHFFYLSVFPVSASYIATNTIQKKFKPYLSSGYFLNNFKSVSKKFEV